MRGNPEFRNSILCTISLAAAVALLVLLSAVPAWAQNAVPPTAREAAASPAFAAKLHPATRPAMSKPRAAAGARGTVGRRQLSSCSDQSSPQCFDWIYSNGPVNGNVNAYPIYSGNVVSDSFVFPGGYVGWLYFYIWESPGDVLSSVDWSITSAPNGGTVYVSGTATRLGDDFISTNQYGYDVDIVSMDLYNHLSFSGTLWINLFNASSAVYWDQNSGPSQAYASAYGAIASEAFDIGYGSVSPPACFQAGGNLQVIYDFTAQQGGSNGLISDKAGNLYGTIGSGGANGAGLAYELSNEGQDWILDPLYSFLGGSSGHAPSSPILGPEGALYGTANGGLLDCYGGIDYCGLVYSLRPAPTACLTSLCSWMENTLYQFTDGDGLHPMSVAAFDQAGNLYGTSLWGGAHGVGAVFELVPSVGGWTEKILYNFTDGSDGGHPSSLLMGNDGNLYGTTIKEYWGNYTAGVVFQLVPSGASWTENVIYSFNGRSSENPRGLVQDSLGNLYGVADGTDSDGYFTSIIIFELSPSNGRWVFRELYRSQPYAEGTMGTSGLTMDATGNLYLAITDYCTGQPGSGCDGLDSSWGLVVMGSPGGNFSNLWYSHGVDFSASGPLSVDAKGNVYGTTSSCGASNAGTVWMVTH